MGQSASFLRNNEDSYELDLDAPLLLGGVSTFGPNSILNQNQYDFFTQNMYNTEDNFVPPQIKQSYLVVNPINIPRTCLKTTLLSPRKLQLSFKVEATCECTVSMKLFLLTSGKSQILEPLVHLDSVLKASSSTTMGTINEEKDDSIMTIVPKITLPGPIPKREIEKNDSTNVDDAVVGNLISSMVQTTTISANTANDGNTPYNLHSITTDDDHSLDLTLFETYERKQFDIVIDLCQSQQNQRQSPQQQSNQQLQHNFRMFVYCTFEKNDSFSVKIRKQYLVVDNKRIFEIYGDFYKVDASNVPSTSSATSDSAINGSSQQQQDDEGKNNCVVCIADRACIATLPCRHVCLCANCAKILRQQSNKCPMCRGMVQEMVRIC